MNRNKPPLIPPGGSTHSRLNVGSPFDDLWKGRIGIRVGRVEPRPLQLRPVSAGPEETPRKLIDLLIGVDQLNFLRADQSAAYLQTESDGIPEIFRCAVNSESSAKRNLKYFHILAIKFILFPLYTCVKAGVLNLLVPAYPQIKIVHLCVPPNQTCIHFTYPQIKNST